MTSAIPFVMLDSYQGIASAIRYLARMTCPFRGRSTPPFIDQIRHQSRPTSLVARSEPHAGVPVVVLVEQQTLAPVRIFLEFSVPAEARPLAILASLED